MNEVSVALGQALQWRRVFSYLGRDFSGWSKPGIFSPFDPPIFHRLSWWFQHRFMIILETNTSPTKALLKMTIVFPQVGYVSSLEGTSFLSWTHFHNPKLHAAKGEHFKRYAAYPSIQQSSNNISEKKIYTVSFIWTPWRKHVSWDFMHWTWFLLFNGI